MFVVSNERFEQAEFTRWKETCEASRIPLPTADQLEETRGRLETAMTYCPSSEEINQIVEKNLAEELDKGGSALNLVYEKRQLKNRLDILRSLYQEAGIKKGSGKSQEELLGKIRSIEQKLKKVEAILKERREEEQNCEDNFNARTLHQQIEEDNRRSELMKKR